jgi:hypothetical protein
MFLIINDFHFWNRLKAGMYMKTGKLFVKAGMLLMPRGIPEAEEI